MKVVFISNFMNHHQKSLCDEFIKQGCEFYFIACEEIPAEQLKLGYYRYDLPYIIYNNSKNYPMIEKMVIEADAVIFGEKPKELFRKRLSTDKATFIFSERLFKKSALRAWYIPGLIKLHRKYIVNRKNIPWLLCAGAYVAKDFRKIGYPSGHALKWGYFPEICVKSLQELEDSKNRKFTMLWVGRFINWKHPEVAIHITTYMKEKGIDFQLKFIGVGEEFERVQKLAEENKVMEHIEFAGALNPEQVKYEMEKAHVLLMTSDRNEGWGAVVNEAMSCACVVVSSTYPGSINYLIENGINGLTIKGRREYEKIVRLSQDEVLCQKLGANAYKTIHSRWNHEIAVKYLLRFINTGELCKDGPMSLD